VRHALTAEYPPDLRSAGVTGTTQVRFLITAEGGVDGATARALWATRPELAAAAVRVVQAMRFRPAQQDGAAVPVWVALPVTFMVPGSQGPPPAADPAARAVPRGPTLLRVATLPDGVALSLDSAAVARTGDSTFVVATVYQRGGRADGRVESLAMDCAGTRVRGRHTLYYGGDVARSAMEPGAPRGWQPVAEGERPVFQALCGYLLGSFAASLPVTLEAVAAEEEPELSNRFEVAQLLSRAYPRRLRDAGTGGSVLLRLLITADGRVAPAEARVLWATRHEFAAAALFVARQMRFTPARTGGRGVASWVTLPMSFSIDGEELPRPPGPPRGSGAPTLPPRP
jgi:TonB family protein